MSAHVPGWLATGQMWTYLVDDIGLQDVREVETSGQALRHRGLARAPRPTQKQHQRPALLEEGADALVALHVLIAKPARPHHSKQSALELRL